MQLQGHLQHSESEELFVGNSDVKVNALQRPCALSPGLEHELLQWQHYNIVLLLCPDKLRCKLEWTLCKLLFS